MAEPVITETDVNIGTLAPYEPFIGRVLFATPNVRAILAFAFVLIFAGLIGCTFVIMFISFILLLAFSPTPMSGVEIWTMMKEFLEILLPAVTALLGSVVGFYFGSQLQEESQARRAASSQAESPNQ